MNVNTKEYWEKRFGTGDWEVKGGFSQSKDLCESQIPHLKIYKDFDGTIVDFGCGAGDSFPIYKKAYPNAKLIGVDFSAEAIEICRQRFSNIATFIQGDYSVVPLADVIIASNVMEHLDDDIIVAQELSKRCERLMIIVPFEERPLCNEHVRSYNIDSFNELRIERKAIFHSRGWSEYGLRNLVIGVHIKNILRILLGMPMRKRRMQIIYEINSRQ
jgi:hypothetical protein